MALSSTADTLKTNSPPASSTTTQAGGYCQAGILKLRMCGSEITPSASLSSTLVHTAGQSTKRTRNSHSLKFHSNSGITSNKLKVL